MQDPQTQTQALPLLQTALASALELIEIHDSCTIEAMTALEQHLDALRSEPRATGARLITSLHREGQLELVRVEFADAPTLYWLVRHILHDAEPDQTRLIVLAEYAEFPGPDGTPFEEPFEAPEAESDLVECGVCGERPSSFTWTPVVGKGSVPAVPLPVCSVCAELIRSNQIPQFSIGKVTFAVLEGELWGARRVTR